MIIKNNAFSGFTPEQQFFTIQKPTAQEVNNLQTQLKAVVYPNARKLFLANRIDLQTFALVSTLANEFEYLPANVFGDIWTKIKQGYNAKTKPQTGGNWEELGWALHFGNLKDYIFNL